jgi:hypothetical protein
MMQGLILASAAAEGDVTAPADDFALLVGQPFGQLSQEFRLEDASGPLGGEPVQGVGSLGRAGNNGGLSDQGFIDGVAQMGQHAGVQGQDFFRRARQAGNDGFHCSVAQRPRGSKRDVPSFWSTMA